MEKRVPPEPRLLSLGLAVSPWKTELLPCWPRLLGSSGGKVRALGGFFIPQLQGISFRHHSMEPLLLPLLRKEIRAQGIVVRERHSVGAPCRQQLCAPAPKCGWPGPWAGGESRRLGGPQRRRGGTEGPAPLGRTGAPAPRPEPPGGCGRHRPSGKCAREGRLGPWRRGPGPGRGPVGTREPPGAAERGRSRGSRAAAGAPVPGGGRRLRSLCPCRAGTGLRHPHPRPPAPRGARSSPSLRPATTRHPCVPPRPAAPSPGLSPRRRHRRLTRPRGSPEGRLRAPAAKGLTANGGATGARTLGRGPTAVTSSDGNAAHRAVAVDPLGPGGEGAHGCARSPTRTSRWHSGRPRAAGTAYRASPRGA